MHRGRAIAERLKHWHLVLLGPLILGIIASLVVAWGSAQPIQSWMWWVALILALIWILLYLAAYTAAFRAPFETIAARRRASRFHHPRVLILDGSLDGERPGSVPLYFTDRRPDDWRTTLSSRNPRWVVEIGPANRLDDLPFDVVVNPNGEAYAEADFTLHTSLGRLTNWVRGGGVYVNVAGYPFWWQHNCATGDTVESGRWDLKVNAAAQLVKAELKPFLRDTLLGISPDMTLSPSVLQTKQSQEDRERFCEIAGVAALIGSRCFALIPYPRHR